MTLETAAVALQDAASRAQTPSREPLSIHRVTAELQLMLAARRAARNQERAYQDTVARAA